MDSSQFKKKKKKRLLWTAVKHRVLGSRQGSRPCSPGAAAGPPAGSVPGPRSAGGSAGQPAQPEDWPLLPPGPAGLRASPEGAAPAQPALQPETLSAVQTLRPQLPALTSSGSGMMQRGW